MRQFKLYFAIPVMIILMNCHVKQNKLNVDVFETSANGNKLKRMTEFPSGKEVITIKLLPGEKFQTITGFGGSFTEASAYLLNQLSKKNRDSVLNAYFGSDGAGYSLTRTHINSCDFSLGHYSYAPVKGDKTLEHFSIDEDRGDIIPMIRDAMRFSNEGFKIISSPWTAPPWMKDNNDWRAGKLLPEYYDCWALFFSKYLDAYKKEGIDIWGITVENEPLGCGGNTAALNPDGSIAVVILNMKLHSKNISLSIADRSVEVQISPQAIQTIIMLS